MARKFSIGFGMVNIPCVLEKGASDKGIALNNTHSVCHSRLKAPKWCPSCQKEVVPEEIIKSFALDKENTVLLRNEELESIQLKSLKSIDITAFVTSDFEDGPLSDPRITSGKDVYFAAPEEVGTKAFVLFLTAMQEAGVAGVGKITMSSKEQLCVVYPVDGLLWIQTLHWPDELKSYANAIPTATVSESELKMATTLINSMPVLKDFSEFKDEYRNRLVDLIQAKLDGREIEAPVLAPEPSLDLEALLKASLAAANASQPTAAGEVE